MATAAGVAGEKEQHNPHACDAVEIDNDGMPALVAEKTVQSIDDDDEVKEDDGTDGWEPVALEVLNGQRLVIRSIISSKHEFNKEEDAAWEKHWTSLRGLRNSMAAEEVNVDHCEKNDAWLVVLLGMALKDENGKVLEYHVPWKDLKKGVENFMHIRICKFCNKTTWSKTKMKMCGNCFGVHYCSRECQKNHHNEHSKICKKVSEDLAKSVKADIKLEQAVNSLFHYLLFDPSLESTAEPYSELITNTPLGRFMYTMQAHGDMFLLTRDNEGYLGVTIYRRNEVLHRLRNIVKECLDRKKKTKHTKAASLAIDQASQMHAALRKVPKECFIIGYSQSRSQVHFIMQEGNAFASFVTAVTDIWHYEK